MATDSAWVTTGFVIVAWAGWAEACGGMFQVNCVAVENTLLG